MFTKEVMAVLNQYNGEVIKEWVPHKNRFVDQIDSLEILFESGKSVHISIGFTHADDVWIEAE